MSCFVINLGKHANYYFFNYTFMLCSMFVFKSVICILKLTSCLIFNYNVKIYLKYILKKIRVYVNKIH